MAEEVNIKKQREALLDEWIKLSKTFSSLDYIVSNPTNKLTHDDIRDWLCNIDNFIEDLYELKTRVLHFMKKPENMQMLENNTK